MKQLKEQTVYIEHSIANKLTEPFENMNYGYVTHLELSNQICLSKDELIELLGKSYRAGYDRSGEQWINNLNKEHRFEYPTEEQFINQILNQ